MPKLNKLFSRKQIDAIREELKAKHGNKCAICEKPRGVFKNELSVDHNHKSNKIRGLLCFRCNKYKLGRLSLEDVVKLHRYLEKYDAEDTNT